MQQQFTKMIIISVIATIGLLTLAIYQNNNSIYIGFVIIISVFFAILGLLNFMNKYSWAKFTGTAILPLWINLATLLKGRGFSESTVMIAFLIFTYVLYNNNHKVRNQIALFTLISHVSVLFYLTYYPPIMGLGNYPYDEIVVFLLSVGWIVVFLKKLEHSKNKLITILENKNSDLLEATEELERFTYIASHDLKSPLRTIISFSDLSERHLRLMDYDSLKEDLSFIKSGAKQMNYLVSDILEFSKIRNQRDIEKIELNLSAVLDIVINNLKFEIQENNAQIKRGQLPKFLGNETEFILLFQNILENGIKYNTSTTPTINIWSEQIEGSLLIHFKDNGIGIDEIYHKQIFQFFKRLHTTDKYQGTGLGLGLCNKIVSHYKGKITIQSSPGNGSTFSITLPSGKPIRSRPIHLQELIES